MIVALMLILTLGFGAGCATKQGTGTAVGGAAGGALGYAIGGWPGLVIGGIAGGAVGNVVGQSMDQEDRRRAAYALEQNRRMEWENAQTGARYEVVPTQTSQQQGRECRNFQMTAYVDGKPDEMTGLACRRGDGSWEMMNDAG